MHLWPRFLLAFCLVVYAHYAAPQTAAAPHDASVAFGKTALAEKPVIDKIDPPDWWTSFPSPLLLVHGHGLRDTQFTVAGLNVVLQRSSSSENGHWAFLWLDTKGAPPQTLSILAHNDSGEARFTFVLSRREERHNAHAGFQNADVLYLILPDRFADATPNPPGNDRTAAHGWHGGDLAGIEQHLDDLRDLGVTTLWTTPVLSNGATPESYHGYAATDLYAIDPHLGTLASYRHLADALHARHMKLVMDLVPNHVSVLHPWVDDPPAPKWLHGSRESHSAVQYDLRKLVDPHAPRQAWLPITTGWFTDAMPDLNQENPLVRQYLIQNALWWVEKADLDGFRLDTFQYVGRDFWRDFHSELHGLYPHLTTVGEILDSDAEMVSFFAGGISHSGIDTGLDTPFDYPLNFALRDTLAEGKPMTELARILRQDELYPHPERLVTFLDNHDTMRFFTTVHNELPKYKLALGLLLTLRGTPQMYAGNEIAMTGGNDPDNRHDFPGGFPGDARNAFLVTGRTSAEQETFMWTKQLLALRKAHPELETGIEQNLLATDHVFAYARAFNTSGCSADHSQERILAIANKSVTAQTVELAPDDNVLAGCTELRSLAPTPAIAIKVSAAQWTITAPAESLSLVSVR